MTKLQRWTREELKAAGAITDNIWQVSLPQAEMLDKLFARRKTVSLLNIINSKSISPQVKQYAVWVLDSKLWDRADGLGLIGGPVWHKEFEKSVRRELLAAN